jgi:hypothetical protein
MPLLFSYGTLQEVSVQVATFGRVLRGEPDELIGFKASSIPIEDPDLAARAGRTHFANATFDGSGRLAGVVFEVTDEELTAADGYEKAAGYVRIGAPLASGKRAWVYVEAGSARKARGPPNQVR